VREGEREGEGPVKGGGGVGGGACVVDGEGGVSNRIQIIKLDLNPSPTPIQQKGIWNHIHTGITGKFQISTGCSM